MELLVSPADLLAITEPVVQFALMVVVLAWTTLKYGGAE